jgi:hypothetical protein
VQFGHTPENIEREHWLNGVSDFAHVVTAFEDLHAEGKTRAWGLF